MVISNPFKAGVVPLPKRFTDHAMHVFIKNAFDAAEKAAFGRIVLDLQPLDFIEPVGVVVLSNLIEYLRHRRATVALRHPQKSTPAIAYLDDSGFFRHYLKKPLNPEAKCRPSTIPLMLVQSERTVPFLHNNLMPWMGRNVGLSTDSLETIRACIEEIFLNISDHSGVQIGCVFAQHYANKNQIHIAVSDFGDTIPALVAKKVTGLLDQYAILEACKEGFTTASNVRNRGAGLPNLMRYVTTRNKGTVLIASGNGEVSAVFKNNRMEITPRPAVGFYPGTLVTTILRTDTIEALASDVEPEEFRW